MPENPQSEPFGRSPYDAMQPYIDRIQNAAGADWTNNVQQHAPTSAQEAWEAWDACHAEVSEIEEAVSDLVNAVTAMSRDAEARLDQDESR